MTFSLFIQGMTKRIIIFLILNFGALAIGGIFTGPGVVSDWYVNLFKAPWTPPGWFFGVAWTSIMVFFSYYMALLWRQVKVKGVVALLFIFQFILNVGWNPTFFYLKSTVAALIIILSLAILVSIMMFRFKQQLGWYTLLLLPYFLWLVVASSLNVYIVLYN